MLTYTLAGPEAVPPPIPTSDRVHVHTWRDPDGSVAYACTVRGQHWIHLPDLASFCIGTSPTEVLAIARAGAEPNLVADRFRRHVLPLALQVGGREVLHASAICTPAGVVALCGRPRTGKSTLAFALGRRGYPLWADDAVCVDLSGPEAETLALPFEIRLRPDVASFFSNTSPVLSSAAAGRVPESGSPDRRRLAAVWLLRRLPAGDEHGPVRIRRLSPARAFTEILPHAYCFSREDRERQRRMIKRYLQLVARIPIYDVCLESDLTTLPIVLDDLEQRLQEP